MLLDYHHYSEMGFDAFKVPVRISDSTKPNNRLLKRRQQTNTKLPTKRRYRQNKLISGEL